MFLMDIGQQCSVWVCAYASVFDLIFQFIELIFDVIPYAVQMIANIIEIVFVDIAILVN